MHRTIIAFAALTATLPAATSAFAQSAPAAVATAGSASGATTATTTARERDPSPIAIDFSISSRPDTASLLLAGQMAVQPFRASVFEHRTPATPASLAFTVEARPQNDGRVLVLVSYREVTSQGVQLVWEPSLYLRRGEAGFARVDWAGPGGRSIRVIAQ
jgi:hypothetical protein